MAKEELWEAGHWRIFRLFLLSLTEKELDGVEEHLRRERAARRERENSMVRLFLSALCALDLETAAEQIRGERQGRAEDRRLARQFRAKAQERDRGAG